MDRAVEIEWEDAVTTYGWQDAADMPHDPSVILSVGYVEQDDSTGILLVESKSQRPHSKMPPKGYGHATFIPRSAIHHVIELGPRRRR